jgi:hypothetical protein
MSFRLFQRDSNIGLQLMRGQWIKEGIAVKFVMALNADLEDTIAHGAGNAQNDIAIVDLAVVQRNLRLLIDFAADQLGGTAYAAAILAAIGKIDPLLAQALEQWPAVIDPEGGTAAIGESDGA